MNFMLKKEKRTFYVQGKVNALNGEKEFYDPETASSSGMSHVPSQPSRILSLRGMLSRASGLPLQI